MEVDELMKCMLDLFNNTDKALNIEIEKLSQKDLELSDLDHYLENGVFKAADYVKIARLRKTLREERRVIKNNIDMINVIKRFTDKYNQKLITGDIVQNLKTQKELTKKQESPVYNFKTNVLDRLGERDVNKKLDK